MSSDLITVCYVKNYIGSGGSSELFLEICNHASDRYEFTVYGIEGGDDSYVRKLRQEGISVSLANASSKVDFRALYRLYRYLETHDFNVVHAHLPYAQVLCRLFCQLMQSTAVVSKQSSMPQNYHPITRTLERVTQPLDTKTITATKAVQEAFTGSSNFYFENTDTKWCTIHNGINVNDFNAKVKAADASDIRENYELDTGPVLLNIGRYTPAKSQKDLIPVMEKVVQHIPDATLLIVGYGDLERELVERIDRAELSDNVYVTGRAESVYRYYKAADLFVLSSRTEGFGIVNLEAMCAELPIVATDIPAVREIVDDGQTGELVQVGNHRQMADEIVSILKNSEKKQTYSRCGLERVREHFDVSQMAAHYLDVYNRAAEK